MGLKKNHQDTFVLYGGDVNLHFDEENHVYTREETGEEVISTSYVTKIIDKPALINWAVSETVKFLKGAWNVQRTYTESQKRALLKSAKKARFETSQEALDVGNIVHEWVEDFVLAKIDGMRHQPPMPDHPKAVSGVNAFLAWYEEHEVEFIASEQKVYSKRLNFSGTFDLLARIDGKLSVLDWKTSKRIYPEYFLQAAGYAGAYEEEKEYIKGEPLTEEEEIDQLVVARLPKDGEGFETKESYDIDNLFEVFEHCLNVLHWKKSKGKWKTPVRKARRRLAGRVRNLDLTPDDIGWGYPTNRGKAHFFGEDGESLCGKYEYDEEFPLYNRRHETNANCKRCRTKYRKEQEKIEAQKGEAEQPTEEV